MPEADTAPEHTGTNLHRGVPGTALCRHNLPAAKRAAHNADAGQPSRQSAEGRLVRLRWRPPAREQRGHDFPVTPYDHAARATLGRRDAIGVRRPRRPGLKEPVPVMTRSLSHSRLISGCARGRCPGMVTSGLFLRHG